MNTGVQTYPSNTGAIPQGMSTDDLNMHKAIEASLKTNVQGSYEPLDLESRSRKSGEPVGLKNIGNTCYFNSLMQTLFRIRPFVKEIANLNGLDTITIPQEAAHIQKKYKESAQMVKNLQELFINLAASNQKYADPSSVLNKCVDNMGEYVKIGDQQDITEYSINFFERIEEVLGLLGHSVVEVLSFHSVYP